jgi:hypothetical protein
VRLFSDHDRGDPEPASYSEPLYPYLDRAGGEYWALLRSLAQLWADKFPIDRSWLGRFSSADNRQHFAAFWELYLATVYRQVGFDVQWMETDDLRKAGRTPDFLITNGDEFILEATTANETPEQLGEDRRLQGVLDLLNTIDIPNFWLWPRIVTAGDRQPATAKLRQELENWTDSLDPDSTDTKLSHEPDSLSRPSFYWEFEGWKIEFAVVPKPAEARGDPSTRPIGLFGPNSARAIDEVTPLRNALARKSPSNYHDVVEGRPYVIALSSHRTWAFDTSLDQRIANALYGQEVFRFSQTRDGQTAVQPDRRQDGFWVDEDGPANTRVSAVLIVNNLWIGDVTSKTPTLWVNPWSDFPLQDKRPWRTALPVEGEVQFHDPPTPLHNVLGLEEDWPGVDPFPTN